MRIKIDQRRLPMQNNLLISTLFLSGFFLSLLFFWTETEILVQNDFFCYQVSYKLCRYEREELFTLSISQEKKLFVGKNKLFYCWLYFGVLRLLVLDDCSRKAIFRFWLGLEKKEIFNFFFCKFFQPAKWTTS